MSTDDAKTGGPGALQLTADGKSAVTVFLGAKGAGDKGQGGMIVEIKAIDATAGTLSIATDKGGEKTLKLAADVKVTLEGKDAKVADLKAGAKVAVTVNKDKEIAAIATPMKKPEK